MDASVQEYCWTIKGDQKFKKGMVPFTTPRPAQAIEFIGLSLRYLWYFRKCKQKKIQPHMDFFNPIQIQQIYGAPIGGIGTGTIGRSFTGDFCRYQLVPGLYEHKTVDANMFTVCIRKKASTTYQQALSTRRSKLKGLKSWNMSFSPAHITYHALYPESWTVYDLPGQNVKLTCHQLSPVIPHNYKDSSLPCALFNWTIENNNKEDIELSLMFTWQSGSASDKFELANVSSSAFDSYKHEGQEISGVSLKQTLRGMPLEYCIGVKKGDGVQDVTYNSQFYPEDEQSGHGLWHELMEKGNLKNKKFDSKDAKSSRMAIAVCVKVSLKPFSKSNIEFSLTWHMPEVSFTANSISYKRFYTRYFQSENVNCAQDIACYSHSQRETWLKAIRDWQKPILENKNLPLWYKRVLFNELYFISDGGTVWFDIKDHSHESCKSAHEFVKENGRFAYLEGQEYRMYNTYDVHFNASFALLQLWPKLQMSLQYDFADTIGQENGTIIQFLFKGQKAKQKSKDSLPHDIGDPENEPWLKLNAYNSHDTRDWRDLNLKFILSVFRDYHYLKDEAYLKHMWPFVLALMKTVDSHDHDRDGLIDSEGEPDQTYDAWSVKGASAYCGGLHLATLKCVSKMADLLGDKEKAKDYGELFLKAKSAYNSKLWNGKYYKYDCSNSKHNDSIMADMCCGHWFLRCSGFNYEGFDQDKIKSCLETIYEYNVIQFNDGKLGAVNGMRPNGEIDYTSMQSEEVWVGVNDSLASLMLYEGLDEKAWKTIEGLYDQCYNRLGLAFQMPEAVCKNYVYRSLGYMRPLCIWSLQYALNELKKENSK